MKRLILLLLLTFPVFGGAVWAQEDSTGHLLKDYRSRIGVRAGLNLADMSYTHTAVDRYSHSPLPMATGGLYTSTRIGKSGLAVGVEALYIGRGTKLNWLDVNYSMTAHYFDLRLPVSYSFFRISDRWAPYVMAAPWVGFNMGGRIDYTAYDYPDGVSRELTSANMKPRDYGLKVGVGAEWLTHWGSVPLTLALEAGYNIGMANTFAEREQIENIGNGNPSVIANPHFGAELWHNTRHSRGFEAVARVSIPFGLYKKPVAPVKEEEEEPHEPIPMPGDMMSAMMRVYEEPEVIVEEPAYVPKDCYTIAEMSAFLTLGYDISDKRVCLFDINFDFDSYRLRPESDKPLNEVLMMMKVHSEVNVAVYGHTDSIGTIDYNQILSENRAQSVVDWLVEHGIDPNRIHAEGFGEEFPLDTNDTEEGRFRNRRVEFDIRIPIKKEN